MNEIKYTKDALVNSVKLLEHRWAASVALDDNREYTLDEAIAVIDEFLEGKVK